MKARRGWTAALAALLVPVLVIGSPVQAAEPPREAHGSADSFAEAAVALAWAVLRGADEQATRVIIRIVVDPGVYDRVAVVGRDPFTQAAHWLLQSTATAQLADLVLPRSHFANYPRTELLLYAARESGNVPKLMIFYLGVPDTTPEFTAPATLDADLNGRLARVRVIEATPKR